MICLYTDQYPLVYTLVMYVGLREQVKSIIHYMIIATATDPIRELVGGLHEKYIDLQYIQLHPKHPVAYT